MPKPTARSLIEETEPWHAYEFEVLANTLRSHGLSVVSHGPSGVTIQLLNGDALYFYRQENVRYHTFPQWAMTYWVGDGNPPVHSRPPAPTLQLDTTKPEIVRWINDAVHYYNSRMKEFTDMVAELGDKLDEAYGYRSGSDDLPGQARLRQTSVALQQRGINASIASNEIHVTSGGHKFWAWLGPFQSESRWFMSPDGEIDGVFEDAFETLDYTSVDADTEVVCDKIEKILDEINRDASDLRRDLQGRLDDMAEGLTTFLG